MEKLEYLEHYQKLYASLTDSIDELRRYELTNRIELRAIITAAFVKCFDFNHYNAFNDDHATSFFRMSSLRSICEDLISIKYLLKINVKERNTHLRYLTNFYLHKSIVVQQNFLQKFNPGQIIPDAEKLLGAEKVKFVEEKSFNKNKARQSGHYDLPSAAQMAIETGYKELYDYLYFATSSVVHFRTDVLLKMGWGDLDKSQKLSEITFSYKHYHRYYLAFNTFYGMYLLSEQAMLLRKYLRLDKKFMSEIYDWRNKTKDSDWPEIVTFDHLNIKGPSNLIRIMHRIRTKNNLYDSN